MNDVVELKDGTSARIRPLVEDDLDALHAFFKAMPEKDRVFLRLDVTVRDQLEKRIRDTEKGRAFRLVSMIDDEIAAYGVLELEGCGWKEHVGEVRLFVAPSRQRKGLGVLMARELYLLAVREKVEEIVIRMMRPQMSARSIFRRLAFHREVVLPDYVRDRKGRLQDMILMRCDLKTLLQELEHYIADGDWQRSR
ncbi:GNAT family N-acetyltransferase [bacterium]|nr:GNAT family N-acetyltransferase [bacterium]